MALSNAVDAVNQGFQSLNPTTGVWNGRTLTPGAGISITNQDGTGGNPVITSTGMTPDPFGTLYLIEDFIETQNGGTNIGAVNWLTSNIYTSVDDPGGHPGIIGIGSAGAGAGAVVNGSTSTGITFWPIKLASGILTVEFLVNITATNSATSVFGLCAGAVTAEPTDGVYFLYTSGTNSGKWVGKTASGSVRSSANSNNTVTGGQWDRLKIVVNAAATSVAFYVNGTEITNSPLSTNIPTATLDWRCAVTAAVGGAQAQIDLTVLTYALTSSR